MNQKNKPFILCIPDTRESRIFLDKCYQLNSRIWLLTQAAWLIERDYMHAEKIILFDKNEQDLLILEKVKIALPKNFNYAVAFSEKYIDLLDQIYSTFKIPNPPFKDKQLFRNKYIMHKALSRLNLSPGTFSRLDEVNTLIDAIPSITGTYVIKPTSAWACEGVRKVKGWGEVIQYAHIIENPEQWMVEAYIAASMYASCALVIEGKIRTNIVSAYSHSVLGLQTEPAKYIAFNTLNAESMLAHKITEIHQKVLSELGCYWGLSDCEVFVDNEENIIVCEVACRHPSHGILLMHQECIGVNPLVLLANVMHGIAINTSYPMEDKYFSVINFIAPAGKIIKLSQLEGVKDPDICYAKDIVSIGNEFATDSVGNILSFAIVKNENEILLHKKLDQLINQYEFTLEKITHE